MVEAMALALAEVDATEAEPLLVGYLDFGENGGEAWRTETLRRIMAATKVVVANCRALDLLGLKSGDLPVSASRFWPFADADILARALATALRDGGVFRADLDLRHPGGKVQPVAFTSWPDEDRRPGMVMAGFVDVSERVAAKGALQRLRNEMAHADRISTLGVMTATIVHEIRQPIAGIMNFAQAALRWLNRPEPDLEQVRLSLEDILGGGASAKEIVTRLHGMSSTKTQVRTKCSINAIVEETATFLQAEFAERQVQLSMHLDPMLPPAPVDRVQIQQVLVNLMMNAAQAMADARCWSRTLTARTRLDDGFIIVEIEDTGPGVAPENQDKLFDGFFSTKAGGLGLGLRICRSIVEDHGGDLHHLSKNHAGSIFRFTVPATI